MARLASLLVNGFYCASVSSDICSVMLILCYIVFLEVDEVV